MGGIYPLHPPRLTATDNEILYPSQFFVVRNEKKTTK